MKLLYLKPLYGHDKLSALEANRQRFAAPLVRQKAKRAKEATECRERFLQQEQ